MEKTLRVQLSCLGYKIVNRATRLIVCFYWLTCIFPLILLFRCWM